MLAYRGSSEKVGSESITTTYKALWRLDETKKLVVAYKCLQKEKAQDHLKDFIELASKWSCIQSCAIVRLYGVTLSSPTALVLEYLPYGPFDVYLRQNEKSITEIHLKKVAASLARALWDLSEAGVVHGYIRCRRLLVHAHDDDRIVVKLSGPALSQYRPMLDVHWMPVEFYSDMNMARRSVVGDIWAFATTLWEIFSYGRSPADLNPVYTAKSYERGDRLLRPNKCPSEMWQIITACWESDPLRPQEIMRDINHMLHRDYVPDAVYEEIPINTVDGTGTDSYRNTLFSEPNGSEDGSNKSLISVGSSIPSTNGTECHSNYSGGSSISLAQHHLPSFRRQSTNGSVYGTTGGFDSIHTDMSPGPSEPILMESIVARGTTYLVGCCKKIGSGTYGHVYKGWMERDNQSSKRQDVAVKKLVRTVAERGGRNKILAAFKNELEIMKPPVLERDNQSSKRQDVAVKKLVRTVAERGGRNKILAAFKNELEIMKSLQHANIVEILGYSCVDDVLIVMEYLELGSLQHYLKYQGDTLRTVNLLRFAKDIASVSIHTHTHTQSLQHANIVEILGYSCVDDVLIVMEYLELGSLQHYLKYQGDTLRTVNLLRFAKDIASVSIHTHTHTQSLQHANIVEILGYSCVDDVLIVMEYLELGSLQHYLKYQGDTLRTVNLLRFAKDIASSLQHANIVEILGYSCVGDVLIVMEYLELGSLQHYLKYQGDTLRTVNLLRFAKDIASGMDYISAKNMVHRDLAARNILVVDKNRVKISDFGLARIIPREEDQYRLQTDRELPFKWYAPESAVPPFNFSTKSDVWSYGVTVWEIFTRARIEVPPLNIAAVHERANCFPMPEGCPLDIFRLLMRDCWEPDPLQRPKFIDLVLSCKNLIDEFQSHR
ncbi:hypothetical protein O0L34_g7648 [Tuta absoluta]|nr:hypothetical protein O0L34_g7648 [Tuta absoluta]